MAESKSNDNLFKLLLIGDSNVGKIELLNRFVDNTFSTTRTSTIGVDFKIKSIDIDGKTIKLQIWEMAGQEKFRSVTKAFYRGAMGILCLYDITDQASFDNIPKWMTEISEYADEDVVVMLIGNRCEMEQNRKISKERGEQLANENGMKFVEVSSKDNINVEEAFTTLARDIYTKSISTNEKMQ